MSFNVLRSDVLRSRYSFCGTPGSAQLKTGCANTRRGSKAKGRDLRRCRPRRHTMVVHVRSLWRAADQTLFLCSQMCGDNPIRIHGIAASKSDGEALSPKVWLTCMYKSTLPGPKTKLPPS